MVAAGVVVLVCVVGPVAIVVPNPGEVLGGRGLPAVHGREEVRVDGLAPAAPALRADLEGLGQEVFLGVDQVDQVPQGLRSVLAEPDVHMDAAGGVGVCPSRPEGSDAGLHRFDVFPAANRAHKLGLLVAGSGDAGVGNQFPPPPVRRGHLPSVVGAARVPEGRSLAEGLRDHRRRPLAADAVHFNLDAEGLGLHGVCSFRPAAAFPARPVCAFWAVSRPARTFITLPGGKVKRFFAKKAGFLPLIHARRSPEKTEKNPVFFRRAGTLSDFALRKSAGGHTSPLCSGEVRRAAHFAALLWKSPPTHRTFPLCPAKVRPAHTSALCSGKVHWSDGFSRRRPKCAHRGGGQIPVCAWRRPRPPHA